MSFCQDAWLRNFNLYKETLELPFNRELANGTLSVKLFADYIIQDSHYLLAYGRALSICAAKAYSAKEVCMFTEAANMAVGVENSLHAEYMEYFSISKEQLEETPLSLACHHYTSYLLSVAWSESYPIVLASLLPYFWICSQMSKEMIQETPANNPYQAWIETYSGDDFVTSVNQVITTLDRIAQNCDPLTIRKMHAAYSMGARLEWQFWDSAYKPQKWRIPAHIG